MNRQVPGRKLKTTTRTMPEGSRGDDYYQDEPNMRLSRAFVVVLILHVVAVGGVLIFNNMKTTEAGPGTGTPPAPTEELPQTAAVVPASTPQPVANTRQPAPAGTRVHFLRSGDTLTRVAVLYGVSIDELAKANGMTGTSTLQVGQRLVIPSREDGSRTTRSPAPAVAQSPTNAASGTLPKSPAPAASPTAPKPAPKTAPASPGRTYTVAPGDNPVAIARKFEVNYQELLDLNSIKDPRLLQIGAVLKIPAGKKD